MSQTTLIAPEKIERKICFIREQKVMLDRDLAELYEVETFNLNKAVKRNIERFPAHFMFQLTESEFRKLKLRSPIRYGVAVGCFHMHLPIRGD